MYIILKHEIRSIYYIQFTGHEMTRFCEFYGKLKKNEVLSTTTQQRRSVGCVDVSRRIEATSNRCSLAYTLIYKKYSYRPKFSYIFSHINLFIKKHKLNEVLAK